MNPLRHRPRPPSAPPPRANPTRIAILEHDLLGIPPQPGTAAAAVIALRRTGTCIQHQPVDVGTLGDLPGTRILCTGCGNHLVGTEDGRWRIAETEQQEEKQS